MATRQQHHFFSRATLGVLWRSAPALLLWLLAAGSIGCSGVGSRSIPSDRIDYNQAVVRSWNEQLLLNLVRLRFRDTPFFLQLTSVSTQYNLTRSGSVGASLQEGGGANDSYALGAALSLQERPTVTYSPLQGEKFARQLLSPVPLETILLLAESGWSIERVLGLCVQRLEELDNASSAAGPTPLTAPRYAEFGRLIGALRQKQLRDELRLRLLSYAGGGSALEMRLLPGAGGGEPELQTLFDRAEAAPGGRVLRLVVGGSAAPGGAEIELVCRSLMGVLFFLSQAVEVPEEVLDEGLVTRTITESGAAFDWQQITGSLLRVRVASSRPKTAFVRVLYRGRWFYIDDRDLDSKSTFTLLTQLFSMQAGDVRALTPALTLPLGS